MLLNDFFEITETNISGGKIISTIRLNSGHDIYSGHFPDNPITPGVVQVQMVKEILEYTYNKDLRLISMSHCKFLKILNPNETPFITIEIFAPENPLQISALGMEKENIYFKFSAVFSDEFNAN